MVRAMNGSVIAIIPAYNPTENILELIDRLSKSMEIVCIDDGSNEECKPLFARIQAMDKVHLLKHPVNKGKGRALKTAFQFCLDELSRAEMVVTVDADGQHKIEDVMKICDEYRATHEMILGKRDFAGEEIPLRSRIGNGLTQMVFHYLCGIKLSDTQTGLRVYPISILPELLEVGGERYEYETNILLYCHDNDIPFREVPIQTIYENGNESSHFNPITDSLRVYGVILKYLASSLLAVLVDNLIFLLLSGSVSNYYVLTYLGRACAAVTNFSINKRIVFKKRGGLGAQILKYVALLGISGTLSATAVAWLVEKCSWSLLPSKLLVEGVLFFFNYYMQKKFVFRKGK